MSGMSTTDTDLEPTINAQNVGVAPVLVTGAAGYIGSILVRRLLDRGYHVRVLDRLMYGDDAIRDILDHPHLEMVVADFRDRMVVTRALEGVGAIVHLGAIVGDLACAIDEVLTVGTNLDATRMIAEIARQMGISRMIFASSCSVYGASDETLDETSALNPVSLYASTKVTAEDALLAMAGADFAPVIMRFATAYGHSYRPRFDLAVNVMTAKAVAEGRITIHGGEQWRPFVHVDDIARALVLALEAPLAAVAGETFNVGSDGQNHQLKEIGAIIQRLIPHAEVQTNDLVTDRRNYYVRFAKIRAALNFTPAHTLEQSIVETKGALDTGAVPDYRDRRYNNYQFLSQIVGEVAERNRPFVALVSRSASMTDAMLSASCDD